LQGQASFDLRQACYAIGDFGRAAELLRGNVVAADREAGRPNKDVLLRSQAWLARTLGTLGEFVEGRRHEDEALALHQLGVVHAYVDPPDAALAAAHYQQALYLADELGMHPLQARCHLGLGTLYAKIDQREHAREELSTALELYRAMDMTFWLPQAEAVLAQMQAP
jgi:tetratricopeptide (TPR) repeat protein